VKTCVVEFVVSFLVSGDNIVLRQLMDVKGGKVCVLAL